MKLIRLPLAMFAALSWGLFAPIGLQAQTTPSAPPAASSAQHPMAEGEVRRIDKEAGKLTLKHGFIASLDMPPMTMVFTVKNKSLLDPIQAGDKVRFQAIEVQGQMVVTEIQSVR